MFPYGMIIASQLLNKNSKRKPNPPLIDTLPNYIQMPTIDFYNLLVQKSERVGVLEMCNLIKNYQKFDSLSEKQKIRFVKETIEPEYYSILNRIKRLIKKINII